MGLRPEPGGGGAEPQRLARSLSRGRALRSSGTKDAAPAAPSRPAHPWPCAGTGSDRTPTAPARRRGVPAAPTARFRARRCGETAAEIAVTRPPPPLPSAARTPHGLLPAPSHPPPGPPPRPPAPPRPIRRPGPLWPPACPPRPVPSAARAPHSPLPAPSSPPARPGASRPRGAGAAALRHGPAWLRSSGAGGGGPGRRLTESGLVPARCGVEPGSGVPSVPSARGSPPPRRGPPEGGEQLRPCPAPGRR